MTDSNLTNDILTPPCPVCSGKTMLKDMRKLPKADGYMCFFHCLSCGTEYPRAIEGAEAALANPGKVTRPMPRNGA